MGHRLLTLVISDCQLDETQTCMRLGNNLDRVAMSRNSCKNFVVDVKPYNIKKILQSCQHPPLLMYSKEGCVRCKEDDREHSKRDEKHVFFSGTCALQNFRKNSISQIKETSEHQS